MSRRDHFKKLQKQRYEKRKYRNPYVAAQKKHRRSIKAVILVIAVASAITWLANFLLRSPIYEIRQVMVRGTETIDPEEIREIAEHYLDEPRWIFANQRNRFLFDENGLVKKLSEQYAFENLELAIQQNSLEIQLAEKTSQLLWISQDRIYLVDLTGTLIRELTQEEMALIGSPEAPTDKATATTDQQKPEFINPLKTLPQFRDLNDLEAQAGQHVLTPEEIENIFYFHEKLEELQISFSETRIDRLAGKWMSVLTSAGYDILFDATGNMDQQISNLDVLIKEKIRNSEDIEYIDLRFGDHVYYR